MEQPLAPVEVFYSFAQADLSLLEQLDRHLSILQRKGLISTWQKLQIPAGSVSRLELERHLQSASLILLLVSSDFLASDACYGDEMQRAIQRHEAGEAAVIPILLRSCHWKHAPFADLEMLPSAGKPITLWEDRDAAWTNVVEGIARAIEKRCGGDGATKLLDPGNVPGARRTPLWNLPFGRNPFFTGRDALLARLSRQFQSAPVTAISQPQAVNGLGGIGKTQLALEYAYRYAQEYQTILWASADTVETLNASYNEVAGLLNLPQKDAREQSVIVQAVKNWLSRNANWLLILDNADELEIIQPFLPPHYTGHILLTTRAQWMGELAQPLEVETLDEEGGALLLLRRARLLPPGATLEQAASADLALAKAIGKELDGLPLALDQAGAYIEETSCGLTGYQQRYRVERARLLARRGGRGKPQHPEPVAATWALSFARVEAADPLAAQLLRICAFLAPDALPQELLLEALNTPLLSLEAAMKAQEEAEEEKPAQASSKANSQQTPASPRVSEGGVDEAIAILRTYSLLHRSSVESSIRVHRLVQAVIQSTLDKLQQEQEIVRAIRAVYALFPSGEFGTWEQCARYLPQVQACVTWIAQQNIQLPEGAWLLNNAGNYLQERAQYEAAGPLYQLALRIKEQALGEEHPSTAATVHQLAVLYQARGKYEEAEGLYERALRIAEQALGEEHPSTATTVHQLASLYQARGKYEEAEGLYKRALRISEQALGEEHPSTAATVHQLASLYQDQGKYEEAEGLYKRALRINEQALGEEHPSTRITRRSYDYLLREKERKTKRDGGGGGRDNREDKGTRME